MLTVTEMLRTQGVVGKFVEFYGAGLDNLPLEDRATIANMAPEYGATCGFFPIDEETLAYLEGHGPQEVAHRAGRGLCARRKGMLPRRPTRPTRCSPRRSRSISATVEPSLAGPKRPQDRVPLARAAAAFAEALDKEYGKAAQRRTGACRSRARISISAMATW